MRGVLGTRSHESRPEQEFLPHMIAGASQQGPNTGPASNRGDEGLILQNHEPPSPYIGWAGRDLLLLRSAVAYGCEDTSRSLWHNSFWGARRAITDTGQSKNRTDREEGGVHLTLLAFEPAPDSDRGLFV